MAPVLEGMSTRKRRPNWTDHECLLLVQLMEERKCIVRGKCSTGISLQDKRQAWDEIAQAINVAFPQYHRSVSDCNKKWENLLAKSREEIKRQKMDLGNDTDLSLELFTQVTQKVIAVMNLSDSLIEDKKDPSILQLVEIQQSFDKIKKMKINRSESKTSNSAVTDFVLPCSVSPTSHSDHDSKPSASPSVHKITFSDNPNIPSVHFSTVIPTPPLRQLATPYTSGSPSAQYTTLQERMDLEMSILRRQEAVLKLQEEYYTLKIQLMKKQIGEPAIKQPK